MKTDKWLLFIVAYLAFSGAALGYLGTDESFKYVPAVFRFWFIGWLIASNSTAVAIKAFFTENQKQVGAPPGSGNETPPTPPVTTPTNP